MKPHRFIFGICFLLFCSILHSNAQSLTKSYSIQEALEKYDDLIGSISILMDSSENLTINEVVKELPNFAPFTGQELQNEHVYWFAFELINQSDQDLDLHLIPGDFDFFDFYSIAPGRVPQLYKGGLLRPARELTRVDKGRFSVPISLKSGDSSMYVVRVENNEFISPHASFTMYDQEYFYNSTNRETKNLWQGVFHGVLWVMIIYNIFFAIIGKDKTYLYYALYMLTISLYFLNISGYLTKYVFPNHPQIGMYVWLIMQTAAIFYIIFIRKFLDLKTIHPLWYKISRYLLIAVIAFVTFKISYFLIYKEYGILSYLSQIVLFMGAVFTAGLIFSLHQTHNRLAQYFTIGSVALGLGLLVSSIIAFVGEAYSGPFFQSIQIGIVFEIIFFSIGLSYKMRETERAKRLAQDELVGQLKKNEKLQLEYQKELEHKVMERTTQIEQQKETLEEQKFQLEELNEEKNHLISIVAHDLRNPLTSALSVSELLGSDECDEEKLNMNKVVLKSLRRMNSMIEKILDVKAIESRAIQIDREVFDLSKETDVIAHQFELKAKRKGICIHLKNRPAFVCLDKSYYRQIIENLLSNAIKFSQHHTNIYVSTSRENGTAFVVVKDEGPGFTAEDKKKVFGKYQKLSARPTGNESSSGIGLSIVKKYVEVMNGDISLNSEPGVGTSFTIAFEHVETNSLDQNSN